MPGWRVQTRVRGQGGLQDLLPPAPRLGRRQLDLADDAVDHVL